MKRVIITIASFLAIGCSQLINSWVNNVTDVYPYECGECHTLDYQVIDMYGYEDIIDLYMDSAIYNDYMDILNTYGDNPIKLHKELSKAFKVEWDDEWGEWYLTFNN